MATFPYKKVLLIGATSGIGLELANTLVKQGVHVIAVGRRQDRLDSFLASAGTEKASAAAFDIADLDHVANFAKR
jgi:NADP-dependent 3-hydroxy acid dehydrogenase YdfG